jgi:hypothetical protein
VLGDVILLIIVVLFSGFHLFQAVYYKESILPSQKVGFNQNFFIEIVNNYRNKTYIGTMSKHFKDVSMRVISG